MRLITILIELAFIGVMFAVLGPAGLIAALVIAVLEFSPKKA